MTAVKIAAIGAGSAQFSAGLINDLCRTPTLAGSEVCLMDINEERLPIMQQLGQRFANELAIDYTFTTTTNREAALRDAHFVINTAYVQGHYHARAMRERTAKHGYYYGGVHLGSWYQLRLMLDVARDIERLCPDAWLIQSGNPVFEGCTLMTRETGVKVCGLCHGHYGVHEVARAIGLDPDKVDWQAPGLNHNIWLTHFLPRGTGRLSPARRVDRDPGRAVLAHARGHRHTRHPDVARDRTPVPDVRPLSDRRHAARGRLVVPHRHRDQETLVRRALWRPRHRVGAAPLCREPGRDDRRHRAGAGGPRDPFHQAGGQDAGRAHDDRRADRADHGRLDEGDATNASHAEYQVNVPNRGALEGLPDDVVVEVPALVNRKGIQPLHVSPLPPKLMLEHILPDWLQMERQLEAFKSGDRSMLLWQVLESHQTRSYDQAVAVLEDLLAMEGNDEMNAAFKYPEGW